MKKIIKPILITGFLLLFTGALFLELFLQRPLPKKEGSVKIESLDENIKIYFDAYGVPHIYAKSEKDLMFAWGYVHAMDRLFQMELIRMASMGRLSEVFGKDAVESDIFLRTLGLKEAIKVQRAALSTESLSLLEAYAQGVNAYIDNNKNSLPMEYTLLSYKPERWKVEHSIGLVKIMAFQMNLSFRSDIINGKIIEKVGFEKAMQAVPELHRLKKYKIADSFNALNLKLLEIDSKLRAFLGFGMGNASNNWAISGKKTTTGYPLLASDPHLMLETPSKLYELHAFGGAINAAGVTLPGAPAIIIGRNQHIAWGLTNLMLDDCDLYIETINPENKNQYFLDGKWKDLKLIHENIKVKNGDNVNITVKYTHRGPIISEVHPDLKHSKDDSSGGNSVISMRWSAFEPSDELFSFYNIQKARSWREFNEALKTYAAPAQNFVYADRAGNIGYKAGGKIPKRMDKYGFLPRSGSSILTDWVRFLDFDKNPSLYNPKSGFVATANYRPPNFDDSVYITNNFALPSRINRINAIIDSETKLSPEIMETLQNDELSFYAKRLMPYIVDALSNRIDWIDDENNDTFRALKEPLDYLKKWDYVESPESIGATIFHSILMELVKNIYKPRLGEKLYESYIHFAYVPFNMARNLLIGSAESPWYCDEQGKECKREDVIVRSALDAVNRLKSTLCPQVSKWRWGRVHKVKFNHPMSKVKILDTLFFGIGPFVMGGSAGAVKSMGYFLERPFDVSYGPSARVIIDFSNDRAFKSVLPTGQSGQFISPHYKDQTQLWLRGKYHSILTDWEEIRRSKFKLLTLKPR